MRRITATTKSARYNMCLESFEDASLPSLRCGGKVGKGVAPVRGTRDMARYGEIWGDIPHLGCPAAPWSR